MTLMQVVTLTRSLGQRLSENPERWGWSDASGARVELSLVDGRLVAWQLLRDESPTPPT
jgi:hypothetical protein